MGTRSLDQRLVGALLRGDARPHRKGLASPTIPDLGLARVQGIDLRIMTRGDSDLKDRAAR
jgi:hypothetical protein